MNIQRALLIPVVLLLGAVGAAAQDYIFLNFKWGYVDHILPGNPPCFSSHPVAPMVYDSTPWFVWTCDDGRVIARRFIAAAPTPAAYMPPTPTPTLAPLPKPTGCLTMQPGPGWVCGADGGWRPGS